MGGKEEGNSRKRQEGRKKGGRKELKEKRVGRCGREGRGGR